MSTTEAILAQIGDERVRQHAKWGEQNHPDGTGPDTTPLLRILPVESTQANVLAANAQVSTDQAAFRGRVTFADILLEEVFEALAESDPAKLRTELIQAAAVATQWVEAIDRRTAEATR